MSDNNINIGFDVVASQTMNILAAYKRFLRPHLLRELERGGTHPK